MEAQTSVAGAAAAGTTPPAAIAPTPAITGPAMARALSISIAAPVLGLEALAGNLAAGQTLTGAQLTALHALSAQFQAIRTQSQQLARLAEGAVKATPERIALHNAVIEVLLQRGAPWRPKVADLHQRLEPVDVLAEPGLLSILLEAAFAWTGGLGEKLTVKLETMQWPRHARLTARALGRAQDATSGPDHPQADNLSWQLLVQAAEAAGAVLRRELTPDRAYLTLEFPATVPPESGLSLLDSEPGGAQGWRLGSGTQAQTGDHVVLITDDARAQRHVRAACRRLGLEMRAFSNVNEAALDAAGAVPAALIVDGLLHDDAFDQLREQFSANGHHVPTIEIGDSQSGFEVSSWDTRSLSRINRDMLETQMESVLSLELGR